MHSYKGDLKFIESKLSVRQISVGCYFVHHEKSENPRKKKSFSCNFTSHHHHHHHHLHEIQIAEKQVKKKIFAKNPFSFNSF